MATQTQRFNKLAGKHVLIIGGTSGIGFGVAEASVESGAHVTISSSSQSRIDEKVAQLKTTYPDTKTTIQGFVCDLSQPTLETSIKTLFSNTGKVDHIVITAGDALAVTPLSEHTYESIVSAGQIRFIAPLLVAKIGMEYLPKSNESSIVLTTGTIALKPQADWSVIAGYAAGLHGMTRNLAVDLKPVRVNCVSPGLVDTELWKSLPEGVKRERLEGWEKSALTGRTALPEDVAEVYLWFMKDRNVTGFTAQSDAGITLV